MGVVKGMKTNQFPVLCNGQQKNLLNSLCLNEFHSILEHLFGIQVEVNIIWSELTTAGHWS